LPSISSNEAKSQKNKLKALNKCKYNNDNNFYLSFVMYVIFF
jgi:hypothetical protein